MMQPDHGTPLPPREVVASRAIEAYRESLDVPPSSSVDQSRQGADTPILQRPMLLPAPVTAAAQGMANLPIQFTQWMATRRMASLRSDAAPPSLGVVSESPVPVRSSTQETTAQPVSQPLKKQPDAATIIASSTAEAHATTKKPRQPHQTTAKATKPKKAATVASAPQTAGATPDSVNDPVFLKQDKISWMWTRDEKEKILNWLGDNLANYQTWKMSQEKTAEKLSVLLFDGLRSGPAIRNQWVAMKDKHQKAKAKMMATGEGAIDPEDEMEPEKLVWLEGICPLYWKIDNVVQRDKSIYSNFVGETGKDGHIGIVQSKHKVDPVKINVQDKEGDDCHPPVGGSKDPRKRGGPSGEGELALKKTKLSAADKIIHDYTVNVKAFQERQLEIQEKQLERLMQKDAWKEKLEETRMNLKHEREMKRLAIAEEEARSKRLMLELELAKVHQAAGNKTVRDLEE